MLCHSTSCTGCTACASVCPKNCITMKADADGFSYPVVDEAACVGCGLCEKACPVLTEVQYKHTPSAYAARTLDTAMRLQSSSGGVFTELAREILSQGGAVFGAAYDVDFRVIHICAEDEAQLALGVAGHDHVHVNIRATVLSVFQIQHAFAFHDAHGNRGHLADNRRIHQLALLHQLVHSKAQRGKSAGDGSGAGAAVGLNDVAVDINRAFAQQIEVAGSTE